jgi:hypothetical protein
MAKKTQLTMEFMVIMTIMFLIFSAFSVVMLNQILEIKKEKTWNQLKELGDAIKSEVDIAASVENGYKRSFDIPGKIDGRAYEIDILSEVIGNKSSIVISFINSTGFESYYTTVPINVMGKIYVGGNNITKNSTTICLNKC